MTEPTGTSSRPKSWITGPVLAVALVVLFLTALATGYLLTKPGGTVATGTDGGQPTGTPSTTYVLDDPQAAPTEVKDELFLILGCDDQYSSWDDSVLPSMYGYSELNCRVASDPDSYQAQIFGEDDALGAWIGDVRIVDTESDWGNIGALGPGTPFCESTYRKFAGPTWAAIIDSDVAIGSDLSTYAADWDCS